MRDRSDDLTQTDKKNQASHPFRNQSYWVAKGNVKTPFVKQDHVKGELSPPQRATVFSEDISWFVRYEDGTCQRIHRHKARQLLIGLLGTRQKAERWLDQLRLEAARRNREHCITPSFGTYDPRDDRCDYRVTSQNFSAFNARHTDDMG